MMMLPPCSHSPVLRPITVQRRRPRHVPARFSTVRNRRPRCDGDANVDTNVSNSPTNSRGTTRLRCFCGNYRVTAELTGFKASVRAGIIVSRATIDVKLCAGSGCDRGAVTVTGQAAMLTPAWCRDGQNPDRRSVEALPMFARTCRSC
jgi:hypothetical protein